MKDEGLLFSVWGFIIVITTVVFVCYGTGHYNGYLQGADIATKYVEATGELPTSKWITDHESTHFDSIQDVLDQISKDNEIYGGR